MNSHPDKSMFPSTIPVYSLLSTEWTNSSPEKSVFHMHFLGGDHAGKEKLDSLIKCGSDCAMDVYFSFWINQVRCLVYPALLQVQRVARVPVCLVLCVCFYDCPRRTRGSLTHALP